MSDGLPLALVLSGHSAILMMQTAKHRRLHNTLTGGQLVSGRYGLYIGGPDISSPAVNKLVIELVKFGNPVYFEKRLNAC
jgi:hypothetical protein